MTFYFSEKKKLENVQNKLEKYLQFILEQLAKCEDTDVTQLIQSFQSSKCIGHEPVFKLEIQEIFSKLRDVRRSVLLEYGRNIPDLKLFQDDLVNILNIIQDLKSHSQLKLEELKFEEKCLSEEVKLYSERMTSEEFKTNLPKVGVHSKPDLFTSVPKDVKNFMDFVNSDGYENGWTVSDHHLFLKMRKKYTDIDSLAYNLNKILPDISVEDVKKHEDWYVKYLRLKEKQNDAIKRWRQIKAECKIKDIDKCDINEESINHQLQCIENTEIKEAQRRKIKTDLENWKKEREMKKTMVETLDACKSKEIELKEKEKKEANKQKSEMVKLWKANICAIREEKKKCENAKTIIEHNVRASVANKMIKLYQMQDKILMNRKCFEPKTKSTTCNKTNTYCHVSRDPNRLFRATQQWKNRLLANNELYSRRHVNFINQIPKLQVPSWRKGL